MKQYLDAFQTAYLEQLGVTPPQSISNLVPTPSIDYSIGELIEILPQSFFNKNKTECTLSIITGGLGTYEVLYTGFEFCIRTCKYELIDALYFMVIKLKQDGII